eukprot:10685206-Karenia_brevis.AAC.1
MPFPPTIRPWHHVDIMQLRWFRRPASVANLAQPHWAIDVQNAGLPARARARRSSWTGWTGWTGFWRLLRGLWLDWAPESAKGP